MAGSESASFRDHFQDLNDPRVERTRKHPLINIVFIAVCGVLSGANSFASIHEFALDRTTWFARYLDLTNGIPSEDTFGRVLARLNPAEFENCLLSWIQAVQEVTAHRLIPIDGKALRGSYDRRDGRAAIHMVSAWAAENQLSLGQVVVQEKSNEITAIPELLRLLEISGAIVTIDAMGCQKDIAAQIQQQGADYVLAVKENQPRLLEDIQAAVARHCDRPAGAGDEANWFETVDVGHGRNEVRTYTLLTDLSAIRDRELWAGLYGICVAGSERTVGGETTTEIRYYIGSLRGSVQQYARAIRGHWGIENGLHWVLDVLFREDHSRSRPEHGAENLAWLRRMAVSLLRNDTTCERSLRQKSIKALCDHEFLLRLLSQVNGYKEGT
jgi:predicted transposase YbfD/YdcC